MRHRSAQPDPPPAHPRGEVSRQKAETKRRWDDEEMFSLLVSSVGDYAIFMLDTEGHVVTWNTGAERIKGYQAKEIIGRHFSTFYSEEETKAGKPDWELVVAAEEGRCEVEGWRFRKDGTTFWANVVITALRDKSGTLRGYAKVTRDLTARREQEERFREQQRRESDQLREHARRTAELEATKTEFLNLASHELRGPLVVAKGYVSMLEDGSLTAEQFIEVLPVVSSRLARIELIIRQLLEAARLEANRLQLLAEPVELLALVGEQANMIHPLLTPRHHLEVNLSPGPVTVLGDRTRLGAVILNLLDNAVKYSPEGGLVQLRLTTSRDRAFISVRDQGFGIAPEDSDRIFARFERIDTPEARNIGGTGLGLYLAREIAHRHGGEILVDSTPGEGSRFVLSLPLSADDLATALTGA